ncbi:MAG: fucose isomerase, partial [Promethearchaeota archaeon]
MTFINIKPEKITFGVIVGNGDVFPEHLAKEGREDIIKVLNELNFDYVILTENDTKDGVVETHEDAKKCGKLFKINKEKIDGILIILPNFGDEKGIAETLKIADLNVPLLIQASS